MRDNSLLCPEGALRYQHTGDYLGQLPEGFSSNTSTRLLFEGPVGRGIEDGADSDEAIGVKTNPNGL